MPFNLSTGEILVLLVVAVVVFGGRLPDVARKLGRSISEFKRGMGQEMRQLDVDLDAPPKWDEPPDARDCDGTGVTAPPEAAAEGGEPEPPNPPAR